MKTTARLLCLLLATGLLALPVYGQSSGYSPYPTQYVPSGPPTTMKAATGSLGFEVPIERVNHYFYLQYRTTANGPVQTASGMYQMGLITNGAAVVTAADLRSLLVTGSTPSGSYTTTTNTSFYTTYQNGAYVTVPYTYTSYTYVPFAPVEWWLLDSTAGQESWHSINSTPTASNDLRSIAWTTPSGVPNRYFAVPESRLGHALVYGDPTGAWSAVSPGYQIGTYSNGTSGNQVSLHWFTASAAEPANIVASFLADRTDGTKAPPNQTNVIGATWVHDYSIYPLASVTFYLPAAEARNLYVLHYQIPGQVPAAATLWPTTVGSAFSTATANAGTQVIAAGAAKVTGIVAVGANFWLTRNINETTPYTSPVFTVTSALANSTAPKVWSLSPATAAVNWVPMSFGIAAGRSAQSFTVSQPSSFSPTTPEPGGSAPRTVLAYEDYALDHSSNFLKYFVVTALVNPAEPFNLRGPGVEMFSQGQVWVLDGWTPLGGQAGAPPVATPGLFNFTLKAAGPEPAGGLTLAPPSGQLYTLTPSAPASVTLADPWHPGTTWTATERTWSLALAYTGAMGFWSLQNGTLDPEWTQYLYVGSLTNFTCNLGYHAKALPITFNVSLSRWAFDTAPRLRLRQRDGSDFPVTAGTTTAWASLALDGTVWTNSAYFFQADTVARTDVDYWLFDEETGEESPVNTTNLVTWFALPTPAGPGGTVDGATGQITLLWSLGLAAMEGGFEIERRLSGETAWQIIGTVPASAADIHAVLHFSDPEPVVGRLHSYRVRYTYGAGLDFRRSAPSVPVSLTGWLDSDNDGMPDWWEIAHWFSIISSLDAAQDIDSDGVSNLDEFLAGTDPRDPSSVPYKVVAFTPDDEQVAHDTNGVVLLYLNKPLPASVTTLPAGLVRHTADSGTTWQAVAGTTTVFPDGKGIAFVPSANFIPHAAGATQFNYRIDFTTATTAGLGPVVPFHTRFSVEDPDAVGPWVKHTWPGDGHFEVAVDFAPIVQWSEPLRADTVIPANVSLRPEGGTANLPVAVSFDYGTNSLTIAPASPLLPDTVYHVVLSTAFKNLTGVPLLHAYQWDFQTRANPPPPPPGAPYVVNYGPPPYMTDLPVDTVFYFLFSEDMDTTTITDQSVRLRAYGSPDDVSVRFVCVGRVLQVIPLLPLSSNTRYILAMDENVISSASTPPRLLGGMTSFPFTTGSAGGGPGDPVVDPGGKGSGNPDKPKPIKIKITYDAGVGASGTLPKYGGYAVVTITKPDGNETTEKGDKLSKQKPHVDFTPKDIEDGSTIKVTPVKTIASAALASETQSNGANTDPPNDGANYWVFRLEGSSSDWMYLGPLSSGSYAADAQTAGNPQKLIITPIKFDSTDYSRGFDPLTDPSSPWTSVCQEPATVTDGSNDGTDLNLNKHIIVRFKDDDTALKHEVVLKDGDDAKVTVEVNGGMKKETKLKITGKHIAGGTPDTATVYVYLKTDTDTPRHPVATLNVDVLPKVTLSLGIWKVSDSDSIDTLFTFGIADSQKIFNRVNKVFRQACIIFTGVSVSANDGLDGVHYDMPPKNGLLDRSEIRTVKSAVFDMPSYPRPNANIVVVKGLPETKKEKVFGVTPENNIYSYIAAVSPDIELISAHEIGHQLTLSQVDASTSHDDGRYPTDTKGKKWGELMMTYHKKKKSTEWLRRVDWKAANGQAKTLLVP